MHSSGSFPSGTRTTRISTEKNLVVDIAQKVDHSAGAESGVAIDDFHDSAAAALSQTGGFCWVVQEALYGLHKRLARTLRELVLV